MAQRKPQEPQEQDVGGRPPSVLTPKAFGRNKGEQRPPRNLRELGERLAMVGDSLLLGLITADRAETYTRIVKQCQSIWGKTGGVEDLGAEDMEHLSDEELDALDGGNGEAADPAAQPEETN